MLDGESYRQSANTKDREVAQSDVLKGLGWKLHRIWTMDWWDNKGKELAKLRQALEEEKKAASEKYQQSCQARDKDEEPGKCSAEPETEESKNEIRQETAVAENREINVPELPVKENTAQEITEPAGIINIADRFAPGILEDEKSGLRIASKKDLVSKKLAAEDTAGWAYRIEEFVAAAPEVTPMTTSEFIRRETVTDIVAKLQYIIDDEAPVNYDRLAKKTLRAFHIGRSSAQTLEAVEKAMKKTVSRIQKQDGVKFVWRKDQEPDAYRIYRRDVNSDDKRSWDELCRQELKNVVCATLAEKGALDKAALIKETIHTMGYSRSGAALTAAIERGLKFGRRTGEIAVNEEKQYILVTDEKG